MDETMQLRFRCTDGSERLVEAAPQATIGELKSQVVVNSGILARN